MARPHHHQPYSNGHGHGHGYGTRHNPSNAFFHSSSHRDIVDSSLLDDCLAGIKGTTRSLWRFWKGPGRRMLSAAAARMLRRVRHNLALRRVFSFPHALVVVWVFVLLWGERWVFRSRVERCRWSSWEDWPPGATPHRLVLVADPQLIDPHSYPGRPWPLNSITVTVTDNYLRRSYNQLQAQLRPDTVLFLGDLFDGGREWKTAHGSFADAAWAAQHPAGEREHVKTWNRRYGEDFWLREYARFGDIFLAPWIAAVGDHEPSPGQRGRKLIASLPGNHDLGFGAEIKIPVRDRFEAYFGDVNRVDVLGNHTFVSVDTVSLSARASDQAALHDLRSIYKPAEIFLEGVQRTKRKAVERELRFLRGEVPEVSFPHRIEELDKADFKSLPGLDPGEGKAELPTVLLSHVPLYRPPGTPCGPMRERWPPARRPKGAEPVVPDDRNAISVTKGYQYQNVLGEEDSVKLVESVGHVVHAFSGDDHDYCELRHDERQGGVPEITVKSISMAMGVPTPGFLMVSLYNPIDGEGKSLLGSDRPTLQTHLCLLPRMGTVYSRYIGFGLVCLVLLAARALLVPVLKWERFASDPAGDEGGSRAVLPVFKAKAEDRDEYAGSGVVAGFSASRFLHGSGGGGTRGRSGSTAATATTGSGSGKGKAGSRQGYHPRDKERERLSGQGKWGWGGGSASSPRGPPRIEIRGDEEDDLYGGGRWRAASPRPRSGVQVVVREFCATAWRVAWMVVLFWGYLEHNG